MLPATNRLPSIDVSRLLRRGTRIREQSFDFVYLQKDSGSRFGFVVSAKVDKRATVRNRIKRLLREAVQRIIPDIGQGMDAVIVARGKVGDSCAIVEATLRQVFAKIGVLQQVA